MKNKLLNEGISLMRSFCEENKLTIPEVNLRTKAEWRFDVCAYYRPTKIEICLDKCANIGTAGMSWSYPGYSVDRTPYGVIQHELGHHVDVVNSTKTIGYRGDFSVNLRSKTQEAPISGYCPNDGEWFAEIFRLFVTNPGLLKIIRPKTHAELSSRFSSVITAHWSDVLKNAPERTKKACEKKILEALASSGSTQSQLL